MTVLLLLLSSVAPATPLWVPNPEDVEEVSAAVDALWPDGPLELVEGARPHGGEGLEWDGERLMLVREGGRAWRDTGPKAETAVLLARSWLREIDASGDVGWVPSVMAPIPDAPEPAVAAVVVPTRKLSAMAGLGGADRLAEGWVVDAVSVSAGLTAPHVEGWLQLERLVPRNLATTAHALQSQLAPSFSFEEDRTTLAALLAYDLGAVRRLPTRWTLAPLVIAGVEVRDIVTVSYLGGIRVSDDLAPATSARIGPDLGLGAEVWLGRHLGGRATVLDRIRLPRQGAPIEQDIAVTVSLLAAL